MQLHVLVLDVQYTIWCNIRVSKVYQDNYTGTMSTCLQRLSSSCYKLSKHVSSVLLPSNGFRFRRHTGSTHTDGRRVGYEQERTHVLSLHSH